MTVLNVLALERFVRKHRDARTALADWLATVRAATWHSLADVRQVYPSADGVPVRVGGGQVVVVTVFNIKGNRYRLLSVIHYPTGFVRIAEVLTHEEYSAGAWKERL